MVSIFAHIPGIKVVMPTFPIDAYHALRGAINDNNPVVFLEHRWLHNITNPEEVLNTPTVHGKARVVKKGLDITVVTSAVLTLESLKASKYLEEVGIKIEIIDLIHIKPIDMATIEASVRKTKSLALLTVYKQLI